MHAKPLQTDFSPVDFSFVYRLDDDSLNFFFETTDAAIESILELVERDTTYINTLSTDQKTEMVDYFNDLLKVYSDYELYEECGDILKIIGSVSPIS